ncbi:MAG: dynein heavy chain 7 [Monoraphidium minutum]|nr:MAG: dynein heavy chain 7 [Monoraphidium minutum]
MLLGQRQEVGDSFEAADGGPGRELLQREVVWALDDAVAGYREAPSAAWRPCSWQQLEGEARAAAQRRRRDADGGGGGGAAEGWQVQLRAPVAELRELWRRRLEDRVPFQYLIHAAHWREHVLSVGPGVLVPRPETEQMIDMAAAALDAAPGLAAAPWADLGTGSGALAIGLGALLRARRRRGGGGAAAAAGGQGDWGADKPEVWAVELSPVAAAYAAANAAACAPAGAVRVAPGSWWAPLRPALAGRLGGVLTNPPYIPRAQMGGLQSEVGRHEPHGALDGGPGPGLDSIETAGDEQAAQVVARLEAFGRFERAEAVADCYGVKRFAPGNLKQQLYPAAKAAGPHAVGGYAMSPKSAARASLVLPHSPMAPASQSPAGARASIFAAGPRTGGGGGMQAAPGAEQAPARSPSPPLGGRLQRPASPLGAAPPMAAAAAPPPRAVSPARAAAREARAGGARAQLQRGDYEYMKLIGELRRYPATEDFVYLRAALPLTPGGAADPYALQVLPFAALRSDPAVAADYYTLSVRGLTRYVGGANAEFTTLDQWEREVQLYVGLRQLPVFRQHRLAKAFATWRRGVRGVKAAQARAALTGGPVGAEGGGAAGSGAGGLFALSPAFQGPLRHVWGLCCDVAALRLHAIEAGKVFTLPEFVAAHHARAAACAARLAALHADALRVAQGACGALLEALELSLQSFTCKQAVAAAPGGAPGASSAGAGGATARGGGGGLGALAERDVQLVLSGLGAGGARRAAEALAALAGSGGGGAHGGGGGGVDRVSQQEFAYTMAAARRGEQRRLLAFVQLVDAMIADTLRSCLVASIAELLQATRAAAGAPAAAGPAGAAAGGGGTPLFVVEVVLQGEGEGLAFEPDPEEFKARALDVLAGFKACATSIERLYIQARPRLRAGEPRGARGLGDSLVRGTVGASDADLEEGATPLADLVVGRDYDDLVAEVSDSLDAAFERALRHRAGYHPLREMVPAAAPAAELSLAIPPPPPAGGGAAGAPGEAVTLESFKRLLAQLARQAAEMEALPDHADVGGVRVGAGRLRGALLPWPRRRAEELRRMLPELAGELLRAFLDRVHGAASRLAAACGGAEDYAAKVEFFGTVAAQAAALEAAAAEVHAAYALLEEHGLAPPAEDKAAYAGLEGAHAALRALAEEVEGGRDAAVAQYSAELDAGIEAAAREVAALRAASNAELLLSPDTAPGTALEELGALKAGLARVAEEVARVNGYQRMFRLAEGSCEDLAATADEVALKLALWNGREEFAELSSEWRRRRFCDLDVPAMEEAAARFHKAVLKMERGLPPNKLVPALRADVDGMRSLLPVVAALRNPALKERHWAAAVAAAERAGGAREALEAGPRDEAFTLQAGGGAALIDSRVLDAKDAESALEELLAKVVARWAGIELTVIPYKESKDVALEDSLVAVSTILSSRYVGGIRAEVERVERSLATFAETLDQWVQVQKSWMYLEPIFGAPDIQKQLPAESKAFDAVHRQMKDVMRRAKDRPNALQTAGNPGLLESLQKSFETLEAISKSLEEYLETKRVAFPRFYFLSNDELLEILAQAKNVQAVQPHIGKCFDGIRRLEFGEDPKSTDIHTLLSGEGERVALGKSAVKARGGAEAWLGSVEAAMVASLRRLAKAGVGSYPEEARSQWVQAPQCPSQLVIAISQAYWCSAVEERLDGEDPAGGLAEFYEANVHQLSELTRLVRGELSGLARKGLAALITIDVHARDIVGQLQAKGAASTTDFEWQMQLRYYWEADDLVVRQVNASFLYAYEYLGVQPRLVVTPMTDRCYLTLTGALHLRLGGAPAGPAGTGKTETTKDLGKALGVNCVVFNCGENLDYKFMGKFFAGLAQCGAWACFDEFNRINIEVLSVVAQQLLTIQNALKAGQDRFWFEGRPIRLVATCGVFITMNPGYAGRTELPDNLKALFRPMAMMIPDYALVAEVVLFSEGFEGSRALSRKMVKLYKLASEQLSQQDHYDFGMRAVKSVLVMAGALKRANPDLPEDVVLIRAMRDSNLPKFLARDAELFCGIICDLFPGLEVPHQDHGDLEGAVRGALAAAGLQQPAAFVSKVLQLHDTFDVRFGVMLVGPTGGGKTACYRALQGALTSLRNAGHPDDKYQAVRAHVLNPKAVRMGELYGEYNALTNEWADGLASALIRAAVADATPDRKWVVFDGPVDAIWIESLNTVLDDNCTLCLPNGERIKLSPTSMRMLFEVSDLAAASPATVSRCGMVYVPPSGLGWRPFVQSWAAEGGALAATAPGLSAEQRGAAAGLFFAHVDAGLAWVRAYGREDIPSVDINLVASLAAMMQSLLDPARGLPLHELEGDAFSFALGALFAFAYVWALGGNLAAGARDGFDAFAREQLAPVAAFPGGGTVWDYQVAIAKGGSAGAPAACALARWSESVAPFVYRREVPFFQMLVPTVDTVRYAALLDLSLGARRPLLLTGGTGVGKTVMVTAALAALSGAAGGKAAWGGAAAAGSMPEVAAHTIAFSAQTGSLEAQLLMESKLEKKRKNRYGAPAGKRVVFFVDDVNMPAREAFGAQPPIELLRQLLDSGGFYDRKGMFWKDVEDTVVCAACAPPGGGRQEVSARFLRHFTMLSVPPPSDGATKAILSALLGGFLSDFGPDLRGLAGPLVDASVVQGVMMVTPRTLASRDQASRLWLHESLRVFHDRLTCEEDRRRFKETLIELSAKHGLSRMSYDDAFVNGSILWGDFMRPGLDLAERQYEEVGDAAKLAQVLEGYLDDYNAGGGGTMSLVFFQEAVQHIARISRVLRLPRGNALLVGVGGSGKQSLTRFAAHLGGFVLCQVELTRSYGQAEFREDLKRACRQAGVEGRQVVFLLPDSKIVKEGFLDDISNMLNSGEVPGMFAPDEKDAISSDVREWAASRGLPAGRDACWAAFVGRVRDNLHIVLTMSPVGGAFRARCREFPSLTSCTTIDWFNAWPAEALHSVAARFLDGAELGGPEIGGALAQMCVELHTSVEEESARFYAQLRRRYYTTPKSYLDMISTYLQLLATKREESCQARDRLLNGLRKLQETNALVEGMKADLAALQPELAAKAAATAELLGRVDGDQAAAEAARGVVAAEEAEVKEMQRATQAMAEEAQANLDEALPALEAALDSLKALNKNDIVEIKSFPKPPPLVQMTLEAVCILKQEKPDWDTAKRVLGEANFMEEFDKDAIPDAVIRKLKRYIDDPTYTPESVAKQSKAAMSLCMWTRAMDVYNRVAKVVGPKREKLRQAQAQLEAADAALAEKQAALAGVADLTRKRLERAGKLTSGLADEGVRWGATAGEIDAAARRLVGDVFLAAGCVAYLGAFTGAFRDGLMARWVEGCQARGIPVTSACTLRGTLATPVEVREWLLAGLPSDDASVDNGILVTRCKRWPLMIDPQGQANVWVRALEARSGLRVLKLGDANFLRSLESCVRVGNPVLIEDVGEALDPALEPVLARAVFRQGGRLMIRLGDADIDYDPGFRLYVTTKLSNPHYLPEVCIKVTLINFTVTIKGLEDQLLGEVVRRERSDLEEARDRLVVSIAADKRQLQARARGADLEDRILRLLREAEGNILDDEQLIAALNNANITSAAIQSRVREAVDTERSINEARESYRPAATRASVLYFVTADLALLNPMYQFSLGYFNRLFSACIEGSDPADDVPARLQLLSDYTTDAVFRNVSRGLFEEHKGLFAFLLAAAVARHPSAGEVSESEWGFFLRGPPPPAGAAAGGGGGGGQRRPEWLEGGAWRAVAVAEGAAPALKGLAASVAGPDAAAWREWVESDDPHLWPLPGPWQASLPAASFCRLLLLRALREEKLSSACTQYAAARLGPAFAEPAPWTLEEVFADTSARTPVIFILSTGADPTAALQRFGERKGWAAGARLHLISLGQGQGPMAESVIKHAAGQGDWVCLQNCHLAESWMARLEEKVEELGREGSGVHPDFRLWLTSMPSPVFPVAVLQNGVKLTNEPPRGVKANVARTYNNLTQEALDSCPAKPREWRRLLYSLAFFHAVVQERRKYGALGWNIRYEFSGSDLDCSAATLRMFLARDGPIPWDALEYVVGQINYGGRVTDDQDRVTLMAVLRRHLAARVAEGECAALVEGGAGGGGAYAVAPGEAGLEAVREHVRALPSSEAPGVFGMHANADLAFQRQEARRALDAVLLMQPRDAAASGGARSGDEVVGGLASEILAGLPPALEAPEEAAGGGAGVQQQHQSPQQQQEGHGAPSAPPLDGAQPDGGVADQPAHAARAPALDSLAVVLGQEVERFRRLAAVLRASLAELQRAIKGQVVMSGELEAMYYSLLNNKVPELWARAAYPSLKPLGSWVADYAERVAFMREWMTDGAPACYWLPGLFFPQGFMTGVLQAHARKYAVPIDTLTFGFEVQPQLSREEVSAPPRDGVLVSGLWLEGASWDAANGWLADPRPGAMLAPLPVLHLRPRAEAAGGGGAGGGAREEGRYACPLYKTSSRAGVLSTTGQSTNFVLCVDLPTQLGGGADKWVLQGAALLCMTDD